MAESPREVFGANLTKLAEGRQIIAANLQGHGRTRDINRPLRYESMAGAIAALIARPVARECMRDAVRPGRHVSWYH